MEGGLVNRLELRQLAEDRIADAMVLLAAGRWSKLFHPAQGMHSKAERGVVRGMNSTIDSIIWLEEPTGDKRRSEMIIHANETTIQAIVKQLIPSADGYGHELDLEVLGNESSDPNADDLVRRTGMPARQIKYRLEKAKKAILKAIGGSK